MMFHPTRTTQSDRDIPETAPAVRFARLWAFAERMDWGGRWPRWWWRWLLRKCDEANGFNFEHLEADDV